MANKNIKPRFLKGSSAASEAGKKSKRGKSLKTLYETRLTALENIILHGNNRDYHYYVYLHRDLSTNRVFYVGKGKKNRYKNTTARSEQWKHYVRANGGGFRVELAYNGLCEKEALAMEERLIGAYGDGLVNIDKTTDTRYITKEIETVMING